MDSELVIDYNSSSGTLTEPTTFTYKDIEETGKTTEDELMENEIRAAGQSKKSPNRPSLGINTSLLDDIEELEDGGRPRAISVLVSGRLSSRMISLKSVRKVHVKNLGDKVTAFLERQN